MRVLVVGAGGREHAIAWACEQHGHTVRIASELGSVTPADVDLVIPGPETMLAAGIADECAFRRIPCFGPSSKQARIESSKGFSRDLAASLGVPGPQYARFEQLDAAGAIAWWRELGRPVVVKLDGLAAGKGVTVPVDNASTEAAIRAFAESQGVKLGAVAQPLRAALTGRTTSPPIFDVLAVLGRDESLARLRDQV